MRWFITRNANNFSVAIATLGVYFAGCNSSKQPTEKQQHAAAAVNTKATKTDSGATPDAHGHEFDQVILQVRDSLAGERFYDGIYNIDIKIGFIECNGQFPIRLQLPDPSKGINPLDFFGAKMKCGPFDLPLDDLPKILFSQNAPNSPQVSGSVPPAGNAGATNRLFGLTNQDGVLGVTQLGPVALAPYYPMLPDILDTSADQLARVNKTVAVTLTSTKGVSDSGQVDLKVSQFNGHFQATGGQAFEKVMTWSVTASGFQKTIAGPHLLDTLNISLNMDPLAVPHFDFSLVVTQAGNSLFKTIRDSWQGEVPGFLNLLADTTSFFNNVPGINETKFEFTADLIRFVDHSSATNTPSSATQQTNGATK